MAKRTIGIVDTTLRDGQASVWASRMRVGAMVPAIADLDAAGYDSAELVAPNSQFIRWARDLGENPWHFVERAVAGAKRMPLRLHGGAATGGTSQAPPIIGRLILQRFGEFGIDLTRVGDQWHNVARIANDMALIRSFGFRPIVNVIYSISPYHTLDFYRERIRGIAGLDPFRVCLKDVGGLLTPDAARELGTLMTEELPGVPLEFHGHSGGSFADYKALVLAECGFDFIHTGVPPLADGGAQPSVFWVTENLRQRGFDVDLDLEPLRRVSDHLYRVADREGLPVGEQVHYDERHYQYQLAGGAAAHLRFQLSQLHLEHLWDEVLEEVVRVRADLGYPIMITPYVSWIASQATINVATGDRYSVVTDQVIRYAYGYVENEDAIERMDQDVRDRILSTPRAAELATWQRWDPTREELEELYGTTDIDEIILRGYVGDIAADVLAKQRSYAPDYASYELRSGSLADVLADLAKQGRTGQLEVRRGRAVARVRERAALAEREDGS